MKRKASLLIAAFMMISLLAPLAVFADGLYSTEYSRVIDFDGIIDEAHSRSLDEDSEAFSRSYEADFVFVIVNEDQYQSCRGRFSALAEDLYDQGSYGWGDERSAVMALWSPENEEYSLELLGGAEGLLDEDDIDFISERAPGYQEEYGDWGVMYASLRFASNILDEKAEEKKSLAPPADAVTTADPSASDVVPASLGSEKPSWYPEDPKNFVFFHDESAPRVVDVADIFTSEEEARIESRAWEIINETGKDVVVFTDVSSYGLEQNVYCADFYDFNGYGFGPEREGLCLLFCMDPDDRGFMTVATGSQTRAVFTESSANSMDDLLYEYAVRAEYGEGVIAWLDTVESLYTKGIPFSPDWLPDADAQYVRTPRAESASAIKSFIDDRAGLLYGDEAASLESMARSISETYGIDVMIHTT
ncbi:MAG: TPM domain-containing protein, partial [Firmicutes bacterium]|nr:TPM domain-containing protein [Bacillota bacterium]